MQGEVQAGSAVTNQFELSISGLPRIYFTRVGEITAETVLAEMADRTYQPTGDIKPGEFEVEHYPHHPAERVALETWRIACATGAPGAKLTGELAFLGADGQPVFVLLLGGMLNKGPKYPELQKGTDGEGVKVVYMLTFDTVNNL